jgi:hypothetical protein
MRKANIKMTVKMWCVIGVLVLSAAISETALAEDLLLTAKIQDVVLALDKNGRQYVRVIVNEERSLKGITYEVGVPIMAFGSHVEKAKTLKKGETLRAICDRRESQGRVSYTILKIVP